MLRNSAAGRRVATVFAATIAGLLVGTGFGVVAALLPVFHWETVDLAMIVYSMLTGALAAGTTALLGWPVGSLTAAVLAGASFALQFQHAPGTIVASGIVAIATTAVCSSLVIEKLGKYVHLSAQRRQTTSERDRQS